MEWFTLARVLHILAVVLWIGGVAMVTTVILPSIRKMGSAEDPVLMFEKIEGRFAMQAKITTLITAITGFYMVYLLDAWERYLDPSYWWMHAMTLVWVLFSVVLFILEPFVLHKLYQRYAREDPKKTFRFIQRLHWVLLTLSLIAIAGAVAGSHGWLG